MESPSGEERKLPNRDHLHGAGGKVVCGKRERGVTGGGMVCRGVDKGFDHPVTGEGDASEGRQTP